MKSFRGCPLLVYGLIDSVAIRRQAGGARNSGRVCCSLPSGCLWLVYSCLQDGAQVLHPCSWSMGRSSPAHVHFLATRSAAHLSSRVSHSCARPGNSWEVISSFCIWLYSYNCICMRDSSGGCYFQRSWPPRLCYGTFDGKTLVHIK